MEKAKCYYSKCMSDRHLRSVMLLAVFVTIMMFMIALFAAYPKPVYASAGDVIDQGEYGSLEWVIKQQDNGSYELTITGSGVMQDDPVGAYPWRSSSDAKPYLYNIQRVVIGDGITSVAENAFNSATALNNVQLPASVTVIRSGAFTSCTGLYDITLNDGLEVIEADAFYGCKYLREVVVPSSVTSITGHLPGVGNFDNYPFGKHDVTVFVVKNSYAHQYFQDNDYYDVKFVCDKYSHSWKSQPTVRLEPTCTEEGIQCYECENCDALKDVTILPKKEHDFSVQNKKYLKSEASCEAPAIYYYSCSGCGMSSSDHGGDGTTYTVGEALGHDYSAKAADEQYLKSNATYTTPAKYYTSCIRCGKSSKGTPDEDYFEEGDVIQHSSDVVVDENSIPDAKLLSVLKVLANYRADKGDEADFYDDIVVGKLNLDPHKTDITSLEDAAQYMAEDLMLDVLERYSGSVDLSPYSNVDLTGIGLAAKVSSVILPADMTAIPDQTFYGMTKLQTVTMPAGLAAIGESAFAKCESLHSIYVYTVDPSYAGSAPGLDLTNVYDIGRSAFSACRNVENVTLYSGTEQKLNLKSKAFEACRSLLEVTVPEGTLGIGVFQNCYALSSIVFHDSYTRIPESTLLNTGGYSSGSGYYSGIDITLPESLEEIDYRAMEGCHIRSIDFSKAKSLRKIGKFAFTKAVFMYEESSDLSECTKLKTISHSAFSQATFKGSVKIPDSVEEMGAAAFSFTRGIRTINIPDSMTSIPDAAFLNSYDLAEVTADDSLLSGCKVESIGSYAFYLCGSLQNTGFIDNFRKLSTIGDHAFAGCVPVKNDIGILAGLTSINIPDRVKEIGENAFEDDFAVESIVMGSGITDIPASFFRINNKTQLTISDVSFIDPITGETVKVSFTSDFKKLYSGYNKNFSILENLSSITWPLRLKTIAANAFDGHNGISEVKVGTTTKSNTMFFPDTLESIGSNAFANCSLKTGTAKNNDLEFSGFTTLTLPKSLTSLGAGAFSNDSALRQVSISTSSKLSAIPVSCFSGCGYHEVFKDGEGNETHVDLGLTKVTGFNYVRSVGDSAFSNCYALSDFDMSRLTAIGKSAFANCHSFSGAEFGSELTDLGESAFAGSGIESAYSLSKTKIETIKASTFDGCTSLTIVNCPKTVTSIGGNAFKGCTGLETVYFPVYATLSDTMLTNDKQQQLTLIPELGKYDGTIYRIPLDPEDADPFTLSLPSNAFIRRTSEQILQVNPDSTSVSINDADPAYFSIQFDDKKKEYQITGGPYEMTGKDNKAALAARIIATVPFKGISESGGEGTKTMSIDYPVDVIAVHADEETISFLPDNFKLGTAKAGLAEEEVDGIQSFCVSSGNIGQKTLTLEATAVSTDEEYHGQITDVAKWEVIEGDSLEVSKVVKTPGNEICDTTAEFNIVGKGVSIVRLRFDNTHVDNDADDPCKLIRINVVDPITAVTWTLREIGEGHANPPEVMMADGDTDKLNAVPEPAGTGDYFTFTSNKPDLVSVNFRTGEFEAHAPQTASGQDTAVITVGNAANTLKGKTFSVTVRSKGSEIAPMYVDVNGRTGLDDRGWIYTGEPENYEAVTLPTYATKGVTWTVDAAYGSVAEISGNVNGGRFTGIKPTLGKTVKITATSDIANAKGKKAAGSISINLIRPADEITFKDKDVPPVVAMGSVNSMQLSNNTGQKKGAVRTPSDSWEDVTFTISSADADKIKIGRSEDAITESEITLSGQSGTLWYQGIVDGQYVLTAATEHNKKAELLITIVDMELVQAVDDKLAAIPDAKVIRLSDEPQVLDARADYDDLKDYHEPFIKNLARLVAAEQKIQALKDEAKAVENEIKALPDYDDIKPSDADDINTADENYNKLTDEQQDLIPDKVKERLTESKVSLAIAIAYEEGRTDDPEGMVSSSDMPDDKLREVTQILVNCYYISRREFYVKFNVTDPDHTDITKMPEAEQYNKPLSRKLLASFDGSINLAPYTGEDGIKSFTGLNAAKKAVSVVMPSDIESIEGNTFYEMLGLKSVVIPAGVKSIGDSAFEKCGSLISLTVSGSEYNAGDAVIDLRNVTKIGEGSFKSCSSLDNLMMHEPANASDEGVSIGSDAFSACRSLTEAKVPRGTLGTGVFTSCQNLSKVVFDDSYTKIPNNTLTDIKPAGGLTVHFPADLTEIGFYACAGSVISSSNLADCSKLAKIGEYAFQNAYIGFRCELAANDKLTTVGHHAFSGASFAYGDVTLPESLDTMGISVFYATDGLRSINIPAGLKEIPAGTFMDSYDLSEVIVPDNASFTSVGDHAFDLCGSLENTDFLAKSSKLASIGDYAFARCVPVAAHYKAEVNTPEGLVHGLKTISIPDSVTSIGKSAFEDDFLVTDADFGKGVTEIPERVLMCGDSKDVTFQNVSLTDSISGESFSYDFAANDDAHKAFRQQYAGYDTALKLRELSAVSSVRLSPDTVSIGERAFFGKSALTVTYDGDQNPAAGSLHFKSVQTIGDYAFSNCSRQTGKGATLVLTGISSVVLPDSLSEQGLGKYAFANNYTLRSVTLPGESSEFSEIPDYCFANCGYDDVNGNEHSYSGLSEVINLKRVSVIGGHAFEKCVKLPYAVVGPKNGAESIGDYAFANCASMTKADIDAKTIGTYAFADCSSLADINLGENVKTTGTYAFRKTAVRTAILTQTKLTAISKGTFEGCSKLETVSCPDTLESIGDEAFKDCTVLTDVNFPVYAKLSKSMLSGDYQSTLVLTPNLGRYSDTIYKIPTGMTVSLPADAFAGYSTEKISQLNTDGTDVELSAADPKYFSVKHVNNAYEITGGENEVKGTDGKPGTAVMISASINFTKSGNKTLSISYPADVIRVHADPEKMGFDQSAFRLDKKESGILITEEGKNPVLYVDSSKKGKTLTLVATAMATADAGEGNKGMITDSAGWRVESGDSVTLADGTVSKTTSKDVCTTSANFTVGDAGVSTVTVYFDDGTDTPPSKTIDIAVIDAIKSVKYIIGSIGADHPNPTKMSMPVDTEDTVSATPVYAGEDETDYLYFVSSNEGIVTVDRESGEFKGVKAGSATITIKSASNSLVSGNSFIVTVVNPGTIDDPSYVEPAVIEITGSISGGKGTILTGEPAEFVAKCLPNYATQNVTWSLSDSAAASLAADGNKATVNGITPNKEFKLTAASAGNPKVTGSVTLTATAKAESLVFRGTVAGINTSDAAKYISLSSADSASSVSSGIVRTPAACWQDVTFTSSDPSVLALGTSASNCGSDPVTIGGKTNKLYYKGLKGGVATITAETSTGAKATVDVKVTDAITALICTNSEISLFTGGAARMELEKTPADSNDIITFTSSNKSVATVDDEGNITAVKSGTAKITATSQAKKVKAYCNVTVQTKSSTIGFRQQGLSAESGVVNNISIASSDKPESFTKGLVRTPASSDQTITFTSSDPSILTVGKSSGDCASASVDITGKSSKLYYKGLKEGTAWITATTSTGLTAKIKVTVVKKPITSIVCPDPQRSLVQGVKTKMHANITPADSKEKIIYESSNPAVATVDANGYITAKGRGSATIIARSEIRNAKVSCTVKVMGAGDTISIKDCTYTVNKSGNLDLTSVPYNYQTLNVKATETISSVTYKVTGIGKSACSGRTNLRKVTIGNNVTNIAANAFSGCSSLKSVKIGKGVKKIGASAFSNCGSLKKVNIKSKKIKKIGKKAFFAIKNNAKIKCPKSKKAKYKKLFKKAGLPKKAKVR